MRRHCQNWQINLEINFVFVFYYLRTKQTKGNNKGNKSNNNNKGSCNESRCLLTALTLSCLYLPLSSPLSPSLTPACLQSFTFCVLHFWVNYFSSLLLLFCCSFCCCCCCCWLYTRDIHMQAKLHCTFGPFSLSFSLPTALRSFPTVSIVFSCYSWLSFGCVYVCVCVCPCVCVSALFSTQLNNFLLMRLRGARCAKVFMINFSHTHARTHRYSTGIATKLASKTHTHKHKLEHTHTYTHFSEHTQKFERNFDFIKFLAFLSYFLYKFLCESLYVWLGGIL